MKKRTTNPASRMINRICAITIAGVMGLAPGAVMAEFSGNIGAASNYVFRGVSLTGNEAQLSGGLDYAHNSGFYAGTWISNMDTSYEVDLYAGYSGEFGDGFSYDVGYLLYAYPELDNSNYGEIYASLSYSYFTAGIAYTINSQVNESAVTQDLFVEGDIYYYASLNYPLQDNWSIGGTVGYYDFDENDFGGVEASYLHGQIDLTKSTDFGDFGISVSLAEESSGDDDVLPFVSWSKSF